MIKVTGFKKLKGGKKKYEITFEKNGKIYTRKFGAQGMSDFTIHKDRERRERYISRHKKDLKTGDPMKPGYLSMYILWNKPTLKASLADYKRRLGVYNRTGKFPKGITGSKKLSFGAIIPFEETSMDVLPGDIQDLIQRDVSASDIQRIQRGKRTRANPQNMMTKRYLKQLLWKMNAEYESPEYATEQMTSAYGEPWLILDPATRETSRWLFYAADILTAADFDNNELWYNCLKHVVEEFIFMDPDYGGVTYGPIMPILTASKDNIEVLLNKLGYYGDFDEPGWYNRALYWLQEEYATGNAFGKKNKTGGSKIPDNVVNKKLYASVKAKIKRSIKGRRWGAYDSGRLVREYKAKGGKYRGSKGKTDLSRWYKEKWVDACAWPKRKPCGRKTKEKIAYCRPSKKVDSKTPKLVQKLTKSQIKSRCAKKKKNPMKRVTKFGETTPDEPVAWGDGAWVIHCNYYPWGSHSTIRYKPLAQRPNDYSYHYGIYNDGTLRLWATGEARNTPISEGLRSILVNYYNTRCINISKTLQGPQSFYISDQYGTMTFGKNQELLDKMRQQMFKQVMSSSDVNTGIQNTIIKRCKRGFSDQFCQDIFTQLLLSIYFTIVSKSKITPLRKNNLKEMESFIPSNFKPTMLNITKDDFSKIDEMLYLLQDHTYGNFKNARVASLIYEYIYQK